MAVSGGGLRAIYRMLKFYVLLDTVICDVWLVGVTVHYYYCTVLLLYQVHCCTVPQVCYTIVLFTTRTFHSNLFLEIFVLQCMLLYYSVYPVGMSRLLARQPCLFA